MLGFSSVYRKSATKTETNSYLNFKFQRASSNERQYRSYLDYVENIGKTCGFDVKEDVLRIPSTKRVRKLK